MISRTDCPPNGWSRKRTRSPDLTRTGDPIVFEHDESGRRIEIVQHGDGPDGAGWHVRDIADRETVVEEAPTREAAVSLAMDAMCD